MEMESSMPIPSSTASTEGCEIEAINRLKEGDPTGMASLYKLYKAKIYSLCLRHSKNQFDADDLTQDVFVQVFRKIYTFRGEAQFKSWLYKIALNFVRLHSRRQRRQGRHLAFNVSEEQLCSVRSRSCNPVQGLEISEAISSLTQARRTALLLHDVAGYTHQEVAFRTGVSVVASKSRLHWAHIAARRSLASSPVQRP
jgi:RNA polymerase sigma-70 factor, ECF subfamily